MASYYRDQVRAHKRLLILRALAEARGNHTQAARALGVGRTYLVRLMHRLDIPVRAPLGQTERVS